MKVVKEYQSGAEVQLFITKRMLKELQALERLQHGVDEVLTAGISEVFYSLEGDDRKNFLIFIGQYSKNI